MSTYAQDMKQILAALESDNGQDQHLPNEQETDETLQAYPIKFGDIEGVVFTKQPVPDEYLTDTTSIEKDEPDHTLVSVKREPPHFLYFLLILLLFLAFDTADTELIALMTPNVNVTIQPSVKNISLTSSANLGKILNPITLSESQTVPTTGHGHQDARAAIGTLTFYNGLSTVQFIPAGTVFTGSDGIQVVTDEAVSIAANNPPSDGVAQIQAHALNYGSSGNISTLDINATISTAIYVKNLTPFTKGQDERDFSVVTKQDQDSAEAALKLKVASSMTAALQNQLTGAEQLQTMPCNPTVSSNHAIGDEAASVQVTVSETCTAVAYDMQQLSKIALQQLNGQAAKRLGKEYMLFGDMQVTITKVTAKSNTALLTFTCHGTWVYSLNIQTQERLKNLIEGKPDLTLYAF